MGGFVIYITDYLWHYLLVRGGCGVIVLMKIVIIIDSMAGGWVG